MMRKINPSDLSLPGAVATGLFCLILQSGFPSLHTRVFGQSATPGMQLQAAIEKENGEGDLKSAMAMYEKIAGDGGAPRDIRAIALLRLAECDEKLGRQAQQIYERIVREYGDQPVVAQARKRLAAIKQQASPQPMSVRKIPTDEFGKMGVSDTDGRRAVYQDEAGNLFYGDFVTHSKHLVFKVKPGDDVPSWIPSRDFSLVALSYGFDAKHPSFMAVVKTDGSGYRGLIREDAEGSIFGGVYDWGYAWSWDNKFLLIYTTSVQAVSRLVLVCIADGTRRELARMKDGEVIIKAAFSPDGKFVAYEVTPPQDTEGTSHTYILPLAGGEPQPVYDSTPRLGAYMVWAPAWVLRDWTADGKYLVICDVRVAKPGLYLLPVKSGRANGSLILIRNGDIGRVYSTMKGALIFQDRSTKASEGDMFLSSFDADGHIRDWRQLEFRGGLGAGITNIWPSLSPDGKQVAYVAADDDPAKSDLVLQDLASGEQRILYRSPEKSISCHFGAKLPEVYCSVVSTLKGLVKRTNIIAVSTDSGAVEPVADIDGPRVLIKSDRDGQIFYFSANRAFAGRTPLFMWDKRTHEESPISHPSSDYEIERPSMDGHWLVKYQDTKLLVQSLPDGEWKTLVSDTPATDQFEITPDSHCLLYHSLDQAGKDGLFRVPPTGGEPERIGDYPSKEWFGGLFLSPDGQRVLSFAFQLNNDDIWVLENYLPSAKSN